ncbi:hypothetical protein [Actinomadura sp. BRA 177]|uniref:hypothetical protein n=1 Tax=Actinomadura sp. BRA 177 TaxID=2745202 RepID=UPI001595FD4C|nr:hypothetical protein [Actinomadura sp. BRA 177]NVI91383.1 hypothetical protein [Actinomadura sp. BRA 177]
MPAVPGPLPAPEAASSWTEFTAKLRALHEWCGRPKYRALCGRSEGLSPAAVSTLIGKNPLTRPPETATVRFVEACLRYGEWPAPEAEAAKWIAQLRLLDGPGSPARRAWWRGRWGAAVGAVVLLVAGMVVWFAAGGVGGSSGAGCQHVRGSIEDLRMKRTWPSLFQCPNRPRVGVYEKAAFGTEVAVLETDPSWFICWTRGQAHPGGNDVWYYTQGDRATGRPELHRWGYVPASEVRVGEAPDPAVTRRC